MNELQEIKVFCHTCLVFNSLVIPCSFVPHQIVLNNKIVSLIILNVDHCQNTGIHISTHSRGWAVFEICAFHNCVLSTFLLFVFSKNSSQI